MENIKSREADPRALSLHEVRGWSRDYAASLNIARSFPLPHRARGGVPEVSLETTRARGARSSCPLNVAVAYQVSIG